MSGGNEMNDFKNCHKRRILCAGGTLLYLLAFILFYYRYVPRITSVQIIMLIIALYLVVSTSLSVRWGTVSLIALIPLTNSLPNFYNFAAFNPLLFFFYGYILGFLFHQIARPIPINMKNSFSLPFWGASALLISSILLTFWRYTNFFPLYMNSIHDFAVNVLNITAGEALRRVSLDFLNYLAGFIWFMVLINVLKTKEHIQRAVLCLGLSSAASFLFGFFQAFRNPALGNTAFWVNKSQINALFTDPNALGVYLVLAIPLFGGAFFTSKKSWKILFGLIVWGGILLIPHSGSRSGFLGMVIVFISFPIFSLVRIILQKRKTRVYKMLLFAVAVSVLVSVMILAMLFSSKDSILSQRIEENVEVLTQSDSWTKILHGRQPFWHSSHRMIREFPVSGIGIGAYTVELPNYYMKYAIFPVMTSAYYRDVSPTGVHIDTSGNFYLQVASELGLVGLFFYLWIFGLVIKLLYSGNFGQGSDSRGIYLKTGLSLGILSFLVILFFGVHTLNFEIQLTFWLCIALLYTLSGGVRQDSKFKSSKKIGAGFLVVLFFVAHAWSSFYPLSLQSRTKKLRLVQSFGLYAKESVDGREFQWSAKTAGFPLRVKAPILSVPVLASHPDIQKNPVTLGIALTKNLFKDRTSLKTVVLDREQWQDVQLDLGEEVGEEVVLVFDSSRTWNPHKTLGVPDTRELGIAIGNITFEGFPTFLDTTSEEKMMMMFMFGRKDWQGKWGWTLSQTGRSWKNVTLPEGNYLLRIRAKGMKAADEWPYMTVWMDDEMIGETWVSSQNMRPYTFRKHLEAGRHRISVAFMNDFFKKGTGQDRNLILGSFEIFKVEP